MIGSLIAVAIIALLIGAVWLMGKGRDTRT
jgi:hypothetical protein